MTITAYYPPAFDTTYCKATSIYSTSYAAHMAFDPATSLTGSWSNNQWLVSAGQYAQRLHCDLGEERIINKFTINNSHSSGGSLTSGAKLVEIYGTDDAAEFNDVTGFLLPNGTLLKRFSLAQHVASDVADPQIIELNNNTPYRYFCFIIHTWHVATALNRGIRQIECQFDDAIVYDPSAELLPKGWAQDPKHANYTVSGDANEILSKTAGDAEWYTSALSSRPHSVSGKYYAEIKLNRGGQADFAFTCFGVCKVGTNQSDTLGDDPSSLGHLSYGRMFNNDGFVTSYNWTTSLPDDSVVRIAVDFDNQKIWLGIDNLGWSQSPTTTLDPTGPPLGTVSSSALTFDNPLHIGVGLNKIGQTATLLEKASQQVYPLPLGFAAWTEEDTPVGAILRVSFDQLYDMALPFYRSLLEQDYHLTVRCAAHLEQIYGLRMLVVFSQLYGNSPRFRARLSQHYGDFSLFRRMFTQNYGDAARYRQQFDQGWDMPDGLRRIFEQRYSISEAGYRAMVDHVYDISDIELLRAQLDQLYVLAAGEALVQRNEQAVYCAGAEHTSVYNIMIEQDESLFYMVGELQLADETEFLQYHPFSTEVVIEVDDRQYHFIVDADPRRSRQPGENVFVVPLVSKTVLLDSPHSVIDTETLSGMAADLVAVLAAPFTVDWQLVNWFIPPNILQGNGESAISIVKKIVAAAGGIVQTSPAGGLVCRPEYPVSVNAWGTATPDLELTDQDDFFQIDPSPDPRPGYNVFFLTNQSLASGGVSMDIIQQSATENELRVSMLPWSETATVRMRHSGGTWVWVIDQGIVIETIEEQVEIIAGSGQTAKPVYAYVDHTYSVVDLGAVELDESGNVTTAIAENSLLQLTYQTRYWQFWANDLNIEDVQFYPEIIEL